MRSLKLTGLFAAVLGAACTGQIHDGTTGKGNGSGSTSSTPGGGSSSNGSGSTSGAGTTTPGAGTSSTPGGGATSTAGGGSAVDPGTVTAPPAPFEAATAIAAVRKVKNLLTGLAPTDQDVSTVSSSGAAGLQTLISNWVTQPEFQNQFRDKMLFLFRNLFQQTGFIATEDFKPQLLTNGGFDFGGTPGDDAFNLLVQNLGDSFARTAWGLVQEGKPFTEVLTTRRYMMTTGLKSLYLQIEMAREQRNSTTPVLAFKIDESGTEIPLEQTLDPASPNYLTFADVAPVNPGRTTSQTICRGTAGMVNAYTGYSVLFQVLLGYIRSIDDASGVQLCASHSTKPLFTQGDMADWQWVNTRTLNTGEAQLQPYDIIKLRTATELGLKLPRVGFYTTPAFLALWNTNDSNQHRVTANQTLLVALGQSFSGDNTIVPISQNGLDATHSVDGSECYGCHKGLDPLRQFWASQLDFNDRNDFPTRGNMGGPANPRPTTTGGVLAFGSVNESGANMYDLGPLIAKVNDMTVDGQPLNRFAIAITQRLCYFANSSPCTESDPEFRRIASSFQTSNFNFVALLKEMFSSPLVTGAKETASYADGGVTVSISRRDQLCAALSNRLERPDLCAQTVALPTSAQGTTQKTASTVPNDTFSRGSESPVTPTEPTLFYAAATEALCENLAPLLVDATTNTVWTSTNLTGVFDDMVTRVMGYPPSDTHHGPAVQILQDDYNATIAAKAKATDALRSTFSLACQSPTALSFGL
ncbi:MAG: hypothetical protein QM756_46275 [Polyangiaceae bacterium]